MTAGEVSINIHDHGAALDEKKKRVQCNYCGKVLSGFSRLKYHVGGIRGDVVPCEKVAENVRESFRSMLLETKRASRDNEVQNLYHPDLPWKRYCSPDLNAAKRKKRDANQITEKKASCSEEKKVASINIDGDVKKKGTIQITEALRMQMEVQKQLHEQLEVQRTLQLRIEEHARYLQKIIEQQNAGSALLSPKSLSSSTNPPKDSELPPPSPSAVAEAKIDLSSPLPSSKHKAADSDDFEKQTSEKRIRLEEKSESASEDAVVEDPPV